MTSHTVESLSDRLTFLGADASAEDWRRLAHDVLTILVERQGEVIALQRAAFLLLRKDALEARRLVTRAEHAFATVQKLVQLRNVVHRRRFARPAMASIAA